MSQGTELSDKISMPIILKKAWQATWQWFLGGKFGFIIAWELAGMTGGILLGNSLLGRALAGLIGATIGLILMVGAVFIIYLFVTPARLHNEARHRFIENNASYFLRMFGNPKKRKYLEILDTLKSMVRIENELTNSFVGKHIMSSREFNELEKEFSKETKIPILPYQKAIEVIARDGVSEQINKVINKMGLQVDGDMPSEKQTEFYMKVRALLDNSGHGLQSQLENSIEYGEYLKKFNDQISYIDGDTPDWILYLLVYPSSFNSVYLYWHSIPTSIHKQFFSSMPANIVNSQRQRVEAIEQVIDYAENWIALL